MLEKMFKAVTVVAIKGAGLESLYDQASQNKLIESFCDVSGVGDEAAEEEGTLIDDIFDVQSRVKYEVFIEKVITKAKWCFSATEIRKRVF